jgi:hypothetical protein
MTAPRRSCTASRDRRRAYLAAILFTAAALLDRDGCWLQLTPHAPVVSAHVFLAIWTGIKLLADILGTAAAATVTYLAQALAYLATRVGVFLRSTGAMFAKVWDASKIVWKDVLKPALLWIDDHLKRLHDWLQRTFKPVFQFLKHVRERLLKFYKDFVRPVLDTIDFIRAVNRVLLTFHITLLKQLDKVLQQIEQRIEEPFLWIYQQLTRVWNLLDTIVRFDGLFQKVTLIKSMSRYAPSWLRIAVNARMKPLSDEDKFKRVRAVETQPPQDVVNQLTAYMGGATNDTGDVIDAAVQRGVAFWDSLA